MHCFAMLHYAVVAVVTGYFLVCVLSSNMSECGFLTVGSCFVLAGRHVLLTSLPWLIRSLEVELLFELRPGPMSTLRTVLFHISGVHDTGLEFSGCFPLVCVGKRTMSKTLKRMVGSFLKTTMWPCPVYRLPWV